MMSLLVMDLFGVFVGHFVQQTDALPVLMLTLFTHRHMLPLASLATIRSVTNVFATQIMRMQTEEIETDRETESETEREAARMEGMGGVGGKRGRI